MRDAVARKQCLLLPDLREHVITDLGFLQTVEWCAGDRGVHEQHRFVTDGNDGSQLGGPHVGAPSEEGDERLVFCAAAQARERSFVADVLEPHEAVRTEQEIRGSLFRTEDFGVHPGAVIKICEVGRRGPQWILVWFQMGHPKPSRGERPDDRSNRRPLVGPAVREEHDATRGRADGETGQQLGGEVGRDHEASECHQDDGDHPGPAPARADERSQDDEGRHDFRDDARMDRGGVDGDGVRCVVQDLADRGALQRRQHEGNEGSGEDVAGEDVAEEPVPLGHKRRHEDGDRDQPHCDLGRSGDDPAHLGRCEREQPNQVPLHTADAVLGPAGERPQQRGEHRERGESEYIARRADIPDDLLGRIVAEERSARTGRQRGGWHRHRWRRGDNGRVVKRNRRGARS